MVTGAMTMIITMGLFQTAAVRGFVIAAGMGNIAAADPATDLFSINGLPGAGHARPSALYNPYNDRPWGLHLPRPLDFTRTYANGEWQVDGVGFSPAADVEIRATGQVIAETNRLQGNLSLRFKF